VYDDDDEKKQAIVEDGKVPSHERQQMDLDRVVSGDCSRHGF
jgi:hypothetical protein